MQSYSLEYLIDFEIRHDNYGNGRIVRIDDALETVTVRFVCSTELQLPGHLLPNAKAPWVVDTEKLHRVMTSYQDEINTLLAEFAVLKAQQTEMKRHLARARLTNLPKDEAISFLRRSFGRLH